MSGSEMSQPAFDEAYTRYASRLFMLVGLALAGATLWLCRSYVIDDALITLRYAQNYLAGEGLAFNPGEVVEGFTNLGHLLAVIVLGALGLDLITAARLIGLFGAALAVAFGPAAILPGRDQKLERAITRLLLLANFFFVYLAWTAMETGLYVGLIALACHRFKRSGDRADVWVGLLAGSLFLVRPDGVLFGAALMALALFRHGLPATLRMPGPWLWVAIIGAVELWRFSHFGYWVPNTALIKGAGSIGMLADSTPWYALIGDDVMELLSQSGGVFTLLFALIALIRFRNNDRIVLAVTMIAVAFAFEIYADGDWMLGYRFLMPMLPFYLSLVAIGIVLTMRALAEACRASLDYRWWEAGLGLALPLLAIAIWTVSLEFKFHSNQYPRTHMTSEYMIPAAKWIGDHYPKHYRVVAGAIGSLAYYGQLVVVDAVGLTNREIALLSGKADLRDDYIASLQPELALLNAGLDPPKQRDMYGGRYRMRRYFLRGIERPWVLYERSTIPEANLPRETHQSLYESTRLHQAESVPLPLSD